MVGAVVVVLRVDDAMVGILNVERGEESSTGVEVCGVCVFGGVLWRCGGPQGRELGLGGSMFSVPVFL